MQRDEWMRQTQRLAIVEQLAAVGERLLKEKFRLKLSLSQEGTNWTIVTRRRISFRSRR